MSTLCTGQLSRCYSRLSWLAVASVFLPYNKEYHRCSDDDAEQPHPVLFQETLFLYRWMRGFNYCGPRGFWRRSYRRCLLHYRGRGSCGFGFGFRLLYFGWNNPGFFPGFSDCRLGRDLCAAGNCGCCRLLGNDSRGWRCWLFDSSLSWLCYDFLFRPGGTGRYSQGRNKQCCVRSDLAHSCHEFLRRDV